VKQKNEARVDARECTQIGHASHVRECTQMGHASHVHIEALDDDDCGGEQDDAAGLTDERLTHDRIHASAAHDRIHASAAAHAHLHAESSSRKSGMDVGARSHLAPHHASFSAEHKVDVDTPFRDPITYRE
jgi:hypothetical protein